MGTTTTTCCELTDGWTARAVAGEIPTAVEGVSFPATVPGCIHLDLLAAGVVADPYLDENERACQWVGRVDWRYETAFDWDGSNTDPDIDLVAAGLDTLAVVELNGEVVARTANMHRSYRFPIADRLQAGRNELAVTFTAPVDGAQRASVALGPRPLEYPHPYNAIRKMASNFGWDWGPDLATAGIWRPLSIQSWHGARIAGVRPLVTVDGSAGLLVAHVEVQRSPGHDAALTVSLEIDGQQVSAVVGHGATSAVLEATVADAALWWPHGFGDQALYPLAVTLRDAAGPRDSWHGRVGFRNVTLDTDPDEHGTPFTLQVNGTPVFARGVNWIPDDCFPSRITHDRYAQRLQQARDANVNLVRIWGGGIYESDDFYDICDELGLLVWQDFLFACAAYAEEEPLRAEVAAEAREAITRLSPHPSLVLWNGGNENIWGHEDWGWKEQLDGRSWGWGYYTDLLPSLLAELDPTRPYSPGSPYSMSPELHPNDPAHGTMHIWDVWNQLDYSAYRSYRPRFVSEFGFQGPPTWATLARSIHDQPLTPESPGMLWHQKAQDGNGKLARGLIPHLPEPASFDDWHWATSLNQARAIALGIEYFRSLSPTCMGTIMWQLNDCWPVTSWAAIDGDGRAKPLWYAMRNAYRDRLLTVQPHHGGLALVAVNDSGQRWHDSVLVTRRALDGTVLTTMTVIVDLPARGTLTVSLPTSVAQAADPARELLLARTSTGSTQAWWHFVEDVDGDLPAPDLDSRLSSIDGGYRLEVTARTLTRDLVVLADRLAPDAVVDDMLITLLPGESATFTIRTAATLHSAQFDDLVLRSANQQGTAAVTAGAQP